MHTVQNNPSFAFFTDVRLLYPLMGLFPLECKLQEGRDFIFFVSEPTLHRMLLLLNDGVSPAILCLFPKYSTHHVTVFGPQTFSRSSLGAKGGPHYWQWLMAKSTPLDLL